MGRAANYLKRPTSRRIGIPAKAGTRPVFSNSSPTLMNKMLSFKRIEGTVRVNPNYIKELNNQHIALKMNRVVRPIVLICLPARSNWL
jgi:hypothetical protein